jgi:hypothetical protein
MPATYSDASGSVHVPGRRPFVTGIDVEKGRILLPPQPTVTPVCTADPTGCCADDPLVRRRVNDHCEEGVPGLLYATITHDGVTAALDWLDFSGIDGESVTLAYDAENLWWYGTREVTFEACWQRWEFWLTAVASPDICYATPPGSPALGHWCWTVRMVSNGSASCFSWCTPGVTNPSTLFPSVAAGGWATGVWNEAVEADCGPFLLEDTIDYLLNPSGWVLTVTE